MTKLKDNGHSGNSGNIGMNSERNVACRSKVRRRLRENLRDRGSLWADLPEEFAKKSPTELIQEITRIRAMAELEQSRRHVLEEIVRTDHCIEGVLSDIDQIDAVSELFEYLLERLPPKLWPGTKFHFHHMREYLMVESEIFHRNPQINDLGEIFRHALSAYLMSKFGKRNVSNGPKEHFQMHPDEFIKNEKERDYFPIIINDAVLWGVKDRKVDVVIGYVELLHPKPGRERQTDPHDQIRKVLRAFKARLEQIQWMLLMEEHKRFALEDPLTGIANRRGFFEDTTALRKQHPGAGFSVIALDLDRFKSINDRHGHEAGDDTLKAVSRKIRETIGNKKEIVISRFWGEEFVIYCQSFEDTEAAAIAEILRKALETVIIRSAKGDFGITASFGVATSRNPDERIEETIARADTLLYRAKKSGRNRIETAHSDEIITEPAYYQKGAYTTKPEISNRRTNWIKTLRSLF